MRLGAFVEVGWWSSTYEVPGEFSSVNICSCLFQHQLRNLHEIGNTIRIVSAYFKLQVFSCKEFRTLLVWIWSIKTLTEKAWLLRVSEDLHQECARRMCSLTANRVPIGGAGIWSTWIAEIGIPVSPIFASEIRALGSLAQQERLSTKKSTDSIDVATVPELEELNELHTMERSSRSGWLQQILKEVPLTKRLGKDLFRHFRSEDLVHFITYVTCLSFYPFFLKDEHVMYSL